MESNEVNSSFFPPPPPRYKLFTDKNLKLANKLVAVLNDNEANRSDESKTFDPKFQRESLIRTITDPEELEGLEELDRDLDLRTLVQPPRLDWIREKGGWTAFGDWEPWPGKAARASLEGMPKLYDEKMERKNALHALLNTMIYSYLQLLDVLGNQGPTSMSAVNEIGQAPVTSNTDQIVSHIELAAFNMHGLCNELRPRQARETLKLMMREQAREKREKARMVRQTCEELRTQLVELKVKAEGIEGSIEPESNQASMETQDQKNSAIHEADSGPQITNLNHSRYDYDQLLEIARSIFEQA